MHRHTTITLRGSLALALVASGLTLMAAEAWWPERAQFVPSGGAYRETLSPQDTYVYDASDVKLIPYSEGSGPTEPALETYADGAVFAPYRGNDKVTWSLGKIQPGNYWLGLQICSGNTKQPDSAQNNGVYIVRINGVAVDLCSLDAPVDVGNGRYAAETQSTDPLALKEGDRITVSSAWDIGFVGKLTLYRNPPKKGPIFRTPGYMTTGTTELWDSRVSISIAKPGEKGVVQYWLRNTDNRPQGFDVEIRVMDYFGTTVFAQTNHVELTDMADQKEEVEFDTGDAPRYRATMTVRGRDGQEKTTAARINTEVVKGLQQTMLLDGQWQQTRIPGAIEIGQRPTDQAEWAPYWVPGRMQFSCFRDLPKELKDIHVGWAKRPFEVPERMKGQRLLLSFERLAEEAIIYVNGKTVGRHYGFYYPTEVDVTEAVRPGINEIEIGFRDFIAYIDQTVLKANGPTNAETCASQTIAPTFAHHYGEVGLLGHVRLVSRHDIATTEVFVKPSTRKSELDLDVTVTNVSTRTRIVRIEPVIKDAGKDTLKMAPQEVEVPAGSSRTLQFKSAFANPHCWFLEDPHMYELAISLSEAGTALDEYRERFGFKEFYAENGLFMLNGRPAKLNSLPKQEGGTFNRHTAPSMDELMDNDERGYMTAFAAPWCVGAREYNLNSDLYWDNSEDFARKIIRGFRNHPSISMWEASNEFFCYCFTIGSTAKGGAIQRTKERLSHLGEVIRQADPTRIVFFSSDGDLDGWAEVFNLHYPRDAEPFKRRSSGYVPDAFFWHPLDRPLKTGQDLPIADDTPFPLSLKYRTKPIMMDEIGQFSISVVNDPTIVGGEEPYRSHVGGAYYWQSIVDGYIHDAARDIESSHLQPWSHAWGSGTSKLILPLRAALVLDYMGNWRSGERVKFQVNIHHDLLWSERMTVRWKLVDANGSLLRDGVLADREFGPSELERTHIRFKVPAVAKETRCKFVVQVLRDGKADFDRKQDFVIYPRKPQPIPLTRRFGLFDPSRKAAKALKLLGVKPVAVGSVDEETLSGLDVLLIGPDAVSAEVADQIGPAVQAFVAGGGRVAVFEQDQPVAWLPFLINNDKVRQTSFAFPRIADHPILKDITLGDLRLWRDDRVVARHDYLKPSRGSFLPILDAGGCLGLEWTPLIEAYFGQGSYVLSQMLLIGKADADPCALKLLANVLQYCDGPLYRTPQQVALVAAADSSLANLADRLSAEVKKVSLDRLDDLAGCGAAVVDASAIPTSQQAERILDIARQGGTVILHGLTAESVPEWAKAIGARVELRELNDYYLGRAIRRDWSPVLSGLSMHELHWHQNTGGDGSSFDVQNRIAPLARTEIVTDAPGAVFCTHPSVFVSLPLGTGTVLLDQMLWDTAGDMVGNWARRIASTLLTNLGAGFKPVPPARKVVGPLAYTPIDLAQFVNRPMADEIADDGQGGWSDQGPRLDGREFPTGRVKVRGIPFLIGGAKVVQPDANSVIVLNGYRFTKKCLAVEGIPVGLGNVETLCFLHTAAWAGESYPIMSYMVNYDDGTKEEIRVVSGININDWWLPTGDRDFLDEMPGVHTQVGLVAENPTFEAVGAYLMEWVNPFPGKKIATIDCLYRCDPNALATPIVMGIAAGMKADKETGTEEIHGDRVKAKTLTRQAEELMAKGSYDQAIDLLAQAQMADPNYGRAAFMLGRSCRLSKKYPEATKAYRTAAGLMPDNTEALNEFAAMLETQGKKIQASAVYRQSLRVNWNQPPVMEAVNRLNIKYAGQK